jgi:cell division protein FtsX
MYVCGANQMNKQTSPETWIDTSEVEMSIKKKRSVTRKDSWIQTIYGQDSIVAKVLFTFSILILILIFLLTHNNYFSLSLETEESKSDLL